MSRAQTQGVARRRANRRELSVAGKRRSNSRRYDVAQTGSKRARSLPRDVIPCSSAPLSFAPVRPLPSASSLPDAASATMFDDDEVGERAPPTRSPLARIADGILFFMRVAIRRLLRIHRPDRVLLVRTAMRASRTRSTPACHGTHCSFSIMKRMNSFAAFGYFVYLKIISVKNNWNSVGALTDRSDRQVGVVGCRSPFP